MQPIQITEGPAIPLPEMVIRSRREVNPHDAINARQFEHWQTDGKYGIYNRPDLNKTAPYMTTSPINSRFVDREYRNQPRFDQFGHRLEMNSYFDKYDTTSDSRNTVRELRATVYEDKNIEHLPENNRLISRNFDSRFLRESEQKEMAESIVRADNFLRPQMNNMHTFYRPSGGSGGANQNK
jgi:hypothetical protein